MNKQGALELVEKIYRGGMPFKIGIGVCGVLLYYLLSLWCGSPVLLLPATTVLGFVYIWLPGRLFTLLLPGKAFPRSLASSMTLLLGMGFLVACYFVAMRLWQSLLFLLPLPVAVCGILLEGFHMRGRRAVKRKGQLIEASHRFSPDVWLWIAAYGIILLLYGFAGPAQNPLPTAVRDTVMHQDILWNTGNAAALKLHFPPWDIRFLGVRLEYHFFTDLLNAIFSKLSGYGCYEVGIFALQPLLLAGLLVSVRGMGLVFFEGGKRKTLLYVFLLFTASSCFSLPFASGPDVFDNNFIFHLLTNINAQTTATMLFAIFFGLFVFSLRRKFRTGVWSGFLLAGAFGALCFAKGPVAAILLCAVALVLLGRIVIMLFHRQFAWREGVYLLFLAAIFLGFYLLLFKNGAASSMRLLPSETLLHGAFSGLWETVQSAGSIVAAVATPFVWLLQTAAMLPVAFVFSILAACADSKQIKTLAPERTLCYLGAGGGLLAFYLFAHQSFSQVYFFFLSVLFLCLLAAEPFSRFLDSWFPSWQKTLQGKDGKDVFKGKLGKGLLSLVTCMGLLSALFVYSGFVVSGSKNLVFKAAVEQEVLPVTYADWQAARWLRENTDEMDIFATNRISAGIRYIGISNLYSALSERQAYMEGFKYVQSNIGIPWEALEEHVNTNAALFDAATAPNEVARLAQKRNISYLVYCAAAEGSDTQLTGFEKVFEGEGAVIYKVPESLP